MECFRYASLAPLYYRGAAAAVVVYDITNPETFLKAQFWVKVGRSTDFYFLFLFFCPVIFVLRIFLSPWEFLNITEPQEEAYSNELCCNF